MNELLLPGEPGFQETLVNAMHLFKPRHNTAFIARPGSNGLMIPVSGAELREYLLGGEYDERMDELENEVDE
ncbi:hypothetical protein [Mastigocoleus testarum]|uniref:Uncharacterized protein n=1 Tax=Mastigocoleus testarum BC008 TaxID=371196 RepID=A0A0V7ZK11_9CYAN|nr:hypothetical protein [Mastigocoleus testarum]KST64075.1 hypothetical protein BC008_40490 [Mastigocoleus testarum BC008]KST64785.1 hypothetical protein BC008_41465 [Mastigocoleus testarum BC008]